MLDYYFRYSVIVDLIMSIIVSVSFLIFVEYDIVNMPNSELLLSTASDIAGISFTSAGFVLTFLTLLISFKSSTKPFKKEQKKSLEDSYNNSSTFNLFLSSTLYTETIRHLKTGVKELIILALISYILKLTISQGRLEFLLYYNIFGLVIISLVLWRSLLVLSGVLKIQDID